MVDLSVVIPSYNQIDTIERCLQSLLTQKCNVRFEIIIVDSSKKEIQDEIEKICLRDNRIRLIKKENQTYPGAARNIGIENALGDIIALIDSDCIADKYWIENIYKNIDDNLILSGIINNGTPKHILGTCEYLLEFNAFLPFRKKTKYTYAAATCNFACSKEIFKRISYSSNYIKFEDFLFCLEFTNSGGKILLVKDIKITHVNRTKFKNVTHNQLMLGKYSAIGRRENDLSPKIIFKMPVLAFGLVFYRYFSILSRVYNKKALIQFLLYTPIVLFLLVVWSFGFYLGAKSR